MSALKELGWIGREGQVVVRIVEVCSTVNGDRPHSFTP